MEDKEKHVFNNARDAGYDPLMKPLSYGHKIEKNFVEYLNKSHRKIKSK